MRMVFVAAAVSCALISDSFAQEATPAPEGAAAADPDKPVSERPARLPAAEGNVATTAPPLFGENLTVDEMMARLREVLGAYSPLGPAGQAVVNDAPAIRRGDVIVAVPVQPRRVGRLDQDVIQTAGLFGRDRVVMPAGTPVYFTRFTYTVSYNYAVVSRTEYDAWCGVVEQTRRRQPTREVGWCALSINGGAHAVSSSVGGSPYWPRTMNPPLGASEFTVTEDQAVLAEFPQLELVYTFVEFDREDADVRRGVRVDGGEVIELNNVSLVRDTDGASSLRVAGGELLLHRTENRREARIEVATAPQAYNPDEEEAALRALAEALVAQQQTRAAAQPAPAPEPPPPAQ